MGTLLVIIGLIIAIVAGIWLLIVAFQESILWGLGSILLPIITLIFVVVHWDVAKKPFLIQMVGTLLMIVGAMLGGSIQGSASVQ